MPRRIEIDDELHDLATNLCPKYLSVTGFLNLILDQNLRDQQVVPRLPAYRVGAGTTGQVTRQLTPQQPSLPTEAVTDLKAVKAVDSSAQKIEPPKEKEVENRKKIRAKRTKGCDSFETFWRTYQSLPADAKASNQNKAKALAVWSDLVPEEVSADELQTAVDRMVKSACAQSDRGEFFASQPDCFRWLRDDLYSQWLETTQEIKPAIELF